MTGDSPSGKRRPWRKADEAPPEVREDGTGPRRGAHGGAAGVEGPVPVDGPDNDGRGLTASLAAVAGDDRQGSTEGPGGGRFDRVRRGVRASGAGARAGIEYVADRIIDFAPRIPVRDLATLRAQFPGLGPEEIADKLVAGAAANSATVGAGIGAAAMLPVPPALPAELAAEITAVAAIEIKLIAELHEVYGQRPPGSVRERGLAYLSSWTEERGVDVTKPTSINGALSGRMKRELRQQIMKRTIRSLPNLVPFMIGAAVGALMNRRDTRHVAEHVRKDLRTRQVAWDDLPVLPPLERSAKRPPELPEGLEDRS